MMGEPANTEHDSPFAFAVAQFVFAEPGPTASRLKVRLGWAAKVRKLVSPTDAAVTGLFTSIPSVADRHPGEPSTPEQPIKLRLVEFATSAFHGGPGGVAEGSLLNMTEVSDTVTVPADPVFKVPMMLAEAVETKSKPPARTATGAKTSRKFPKVIVTSLAMY
jgi:hypothetical protein